MNIFGHATYVGNTGYNAHCKNFYRALNKYHNIKIRNFTVGPNWRGIHEKENCHGIDVEPIDKEMLILQSLWNSEGVLQDYELYNYQRGSFDHDINLILAETNHYYFYHNYFGPKIGYTVWESTRYYKFFFDKLKEYDQVWVPTSWQAKVTEDQGMDGSKIKVVPEGVDSSIFYPEQLKMPNDKFRFLVFGRWDSRKSTVEIIRAFKNLFGNDKKFELVLSVEDKFNSDGLGSTKNRLAEHGLLCDNIRLLNFPTRKDYARFLKMGHVFLSCSRSEGWNLPLIEAMACGTPSIYSECSGQLEFASGKGIPIKIRGEVEMRKFYPPNEVCQGNWYEPDFKDLEDKMIEVYNNYSYYKQKALNESIEIRQRFSWDNAAKLASKFLEEATNQRETVITAVHEVEELKPEPVIKIPENNKPIHHIVNESPSLGDIIAWIPMVDKYQKEKDVIVNLYSPYSDLFAENYPNINFHAYNAQPQNAQNLIRIGTYDIGEKKWSEFNLQELAAQLLGIKYEPTVAKIVKPKNLKNPFGKKYVCIATQSTAQFKYWNNPEGWKKTVDYLKSLGYEVVCIDKHPLFGVHGSMNSIPDNCIDATGEKPLSERINQLMHCDFFIGLTSGLSWLAWGLGKPVVFISGISLPKTDFYTPYRVTNTSKNLCHGCASEPGFVFDKFDWMFCPKKKNFECTKEISFEMVKEKIDLLIAREDISLDFSLVNAEVSFLNGPRIQINDSKYSVYLVQLFTYYAGEWIINYEDSNFAPFNWYKSAHTKRQKWRFKVFAFDGDSLRLVLQQTYNEKNKNVEFVLDSEGSKYDKVYIEKAISFAKENECNIFIKTKFYKKLRQDFPHFKNILSPDVILPDVYASYNIKRHEIESKRHDMWYTNKLWIDRARSDISVDHHENWTEYQQENVFDDIINYE